MNILTRHHGRAIFPWKPLRLSLQPRLTRNSPWLNLRSNQHGASKMTVVEKIIHDNIKVNVLSYIGLQYPELHLNIQATGPISFANYMKLCLSHPTHGYYTNHEHKVFGQQGDFITSPEISQTFGEVNVQISLPSFWQFLSSSISERPSVNRSLVLYAIPFKDRANSDNRTGSRSRNTHG